MKVYWSNRTNAFGFDELDEVYIMVQLDSSTSKERTGVFLGDVPADTTSPKVMIKLFVR
jgi:hypothetical protein